MDKKEKPGGAQRDPKPEKARTTTRKGQPQHCSRCGGAGHNRRSCPELRRGR